MEKYAVFLRGINVGGNNQVRMSDLKSILLDKQFKDVKTHLNSGNIILSCEYSRNKVIDGIKEIVKSQFKIEVDTIIKNRSEIDRIIKNNPFSDKENDNSKRMVVMLSESIDEAKASQFRNDRKIEENYYHCNNVLYIYYHNGAGRSKFTNNYIKKKLNVISTARNWNTMIKIDEMMNEE